MKKFQFLLVDAGPIIELFRLGIWEKFIEMCDVTISQTVATEAKFASQEYEDIKIDLQPYEQSGKIKIIDVEISVIQAFQDKNKSTYDIHDGELEMLSFMFDSKDKWVVCSADGAVFRLLGFFNKADSGISLEEILKQIGISRQLEWKYQQKFREKYTKQGQIESMQR